MSEDLARRIAEAKSKHEQPSGGGREGNQAWQFLSEVIAGILVGGGIGWLLDRWLKTGPWLFVVFLILGITAAFWNMIKLASKDEIGHREPDKKSR